jgi:uncharacterized protein YuzE
MDIEIIPLAEKKLKRRGITERWVKETLDFPDQSLDGYGGRRVAQKKYLMKNKEYLLRVIYEEKEGLKLVVTAHEESIAESIELDGIIIDYSKDRKIVSIEILDAGKRTTKGPLDILDLKIIKEKVAV